MMRRVLAGITLVMLLVFAAAFFTAPDAVTLFALGLWCTVGVMLILDAWDAAKHGEHLDVGDLDASDASDASEGEVAE